MKQRAATMTNALALAALLALPAPRVGAAGQCGVCHPEERVVFESSVHAREGVDCTSCHRGDDTALDSQPAHRGDFRSLSDRSEIPGVCAECHASQEKMRPYNLPVDQVALYQTSQHGMAVAGGDDRAAVCTDCHGEHEIRTADDPQSKVYGHNIPATCGRCHADEALMERYGLDPQVIADYRSSVHGKALLDAHQSAAPNCTSCHGVHGGAPPSFGDIDKVCGACHAQARRAFLEGSHYQGMLAAELPECVSCHAHHAIRRFDAASIVSACTECHDHDSAQVLVGEKIRTLILAAEQEVRKAEQRVREAERIPLEVEDHLSRLDEARTYLTEAHPLVHTVSQEAIEELTRRTRSIGEEIQHEIYAELDRTAAHLGLAGFWFYLIMTLAILWAFKRRLRRGKCGS
ncbi:MAG: hypothetical protein GY856_28935 [bacterium]|nr:hypothetical protein [bacterium]